MKKYIVCKIHNGSLGSILGFDSKEETQDVLRGMAEEQFERDLTPEEIDDLNDKLEIINDEDCDNIYTFSIGILE